MFKDSQTFSSFSVNNLNEAEKFYKNTLGLSTDRQEEMGLEIKLATGAKVFVYEKPNHQPASFTILNFPVSNIDQAVDELTSMGVTLEHYDGFKHDKKGIVRAESSQQGPSIAWFTDPAKNILAVMEL